MSIEKYKQYLTDVEANRYESFILARDLFNKIKGKKIVELGTTRSFVNGAHPGCLADNEVYWEPNSPQKWDWGAGAFTILFAEEYQNTNVQITTVDIDQRHLNRCKVMVDKFKNVEYVCSDSESYLQSLPEKSVDFIYQDTADCDDHGCHIHEREAHIIVNKNILKPKGILLIDDNINYDTTLPSKAKYSLPIYVQAGYKIVFMGKQILLQK